LYIRLKYIAFEIHSHDLERNFVQQVIMKAIVYRAMLLSHEGVAIGDLACFVGAKNGDFRQRRCICEAHGSFY
jgi:hypothetical protein